MRLLCLWRRQNRLKPHFCRDGLRVGGAPTFASSFRTFYSAFLHHEQQPRQSVCLLWVLVIWRSFSAASVICVLLFRRSQHQSLWILQKCANCIKVYHFKTKTQKKSDEGPRPLPLWTPPPTLHLHPSAPTAPRPSHLRRSPLPHPLSNCFCRPCLGQL